MLPAGTKFELGVSAEWWGATGVFDAFSRVIQQSLPVALILAILVGWSVRRHRFDLVPAICTGAFLGVLAGLGEHFLGNPLRVGEETYEGLLLCSTGLALVWLTVWMSASQAKTAAPSTGRRRLQLSCLGTTAFLLLSRVAPDVLGELTVNTFASASVLRALAAATALLTVVIAATVFLRASKALPTLTASGLACGIVGIFALEMLIHAYHEFSEAGILAATQRSMAVIGPIVRNSPIFLICALAVAMIAWLTLQPRLDGNRADTTAARRLQDAGRRRLVRTRSAAIASTFLLLGDVGWVQARAMSPKKLSAPEPAHLDGDTVRIDLSQLEDGLLHRYGLELSGSNIRFLAMKTAGGRVRTAMDACEICGSFGYLQEGEHLVCLNCMAEIDPATLGHAGGCNPIPLESSVQASDVVIQLDALREFAPIFAPSDLTTDIGIDPVCGMRVRINEAAAFATLDGHTIYFCSERCRDLSLKEELESSNSTE